MDFGTTRVYCHVLKNWGDKMQKISNDIELKPDIFSSILPMSKKDRKKEKERLSNLGCGSISVF